ncbi:MAG: hypothetical protein ACC661_05835, partial [Verrucomicrobiales bacterium]
ERKAFLRSHRTVLENHEARENLARTLAARDYHRDTVEIYRDLLYANANNNDYARAFFMACENAQESAAALDYLEKLLSGEMSRPEGVDDEYLQRKHALFLWMARDFERLRGMALEQVEVQGEVPPRQKVYHHYLALLLAEEGGYEAALAVYVRIDDGLYNDSLLLRRHAQCLRELGRDRAAAEILERVPLGGASPEGEKAVVEQLAEIHAALGETRKLRLMAMRSLEYDDLELVRIIATSLAQEGLEQEAASMLVLASRRAVDDRARVELMLEALGHSHGLRGQDREVLAGYLGTILASDFGAAHGARRKMLEEVRRVAAAGGALRRIWSSVLAEGAKAHSNPALALVGSLELALAQGGESEAARALIARIVAIPEPAAQDLEIAIESCLSHGRNEGARELLARLEEVRLQPMLNASIAARVHHARGDEDALTAVFQAVMADRYVWDRVTSPAVQIEVPEAFAGIGQIERAARIYAHHAAKIRILSRGHRDFIAAYTRFLISTGDDHRAQSVLRAAFRKSLDLDPALIVELQRSRGGSGEIASEIRKYQLSSGLATRVEYLFRRAEQEASSASEGAGTAAR